MQNVRLRLKKPSKRPGYPEEQQIREVLTIDLTVGGLPKDETICFYLLASLHQ